MITTASTIDITHVISKYDTLTYTANTVHLSTTANGSNKIINTPVVTQQVLNVSDGLITFSGVPLELNGNKITMLLSDNADLDTNNSVTRVGSTYIRRIDTPATSMEV